MCRVNGDRDPDGPQVHHLRAGGVSVVIAADAEVGLPRILYWGADLGELSEDALRELAVVSIAQVTSYVSDDPVPAAILPEHGLGYAGWPGVTGHRDGRGWSPLFTVNGVERTDGPQALVVRATDEDAALSVVLDVELTPSGLVRVRAGLTNTHTSEPYWVEAVHVALPVPPVADELLDLAGRHLRERAPQRQPFHVGTRLRESRRGHGGHDASLLLVAGTSGFGFRSGEVWGLHVAWSGNHRVYAERLPTGGHAVLGGGELLMPGEVRLAPGETYRTPLVGRRLRSVGPGRAVRAHPRLAAGATEPPSDAAAGHPQHVGGGLLRPGPRHASGPSRTAQPPSEPSGSCWTTAGSAGGGASSPGSATGTSTRPVWPDGLGPLVDHVRSPGDAVRAVGRAGDRQPRLRPGPRPPGLGPRDRRPAAAPRPAGAAPGPRQPRGRGVPPRAARRAAHRVPDRLPQVGPQPRRRRRWPGPRRRGRRARAAPRPCTRCSTSSVAATPASRSRAAPAAVPASTSASSNGPTASGPATASTRSNGRRSSGGPPCSSRRSCSALMSEPRTSHTTHRTHTVAFAAGTALFGHFGMELDLSGDVGGRAGRAHGMGRTGSRV